MNLKVIFALFLFSLFSLTGEDLKIPPENLLIEESSLGGYHLWVKKENIGSILLTESTKDPEGSADSYSLRNPSYHPVNGDEKRMLNGEFIDPDKKLYSLIDSTPEIHPKLGEVFHIFIPYIVEYGYTWSRSGEIQVLDGTYLNIRAFTKEFADYSEGFIDNSFIMRIIQKAPPEVPQVVDPGYMPAALDAFEEIAGEGNGDLFLSLGEDDILKHIRKIIENIQGDTLDLVLALDTTKSMENDIPYLKEFLIPLLETQSEGFTDLRFGMVLYKDYYELYLTKIIPFGPDYSAARRAVNGIRVHGGRDIPEAVNEALYAGIHSFTWKAESRIIILIGDAPPHPRPRSTITRELVYTDAALQNIEINAIILPQ